MHCNNKEQFQAMGVLNQEETHCFGDSESGVKKDTSGKTEVLQVHKYVQSKE